mmetsp:Transcript_1532/g.4337  ORF Transcript_1532/g.4337 Transcript_1532/m.4337 type:complete len:216 (+) Transcript_1532:224-871(+)
MQYVDGGRLAHALSTHGPMEYWIGDPVMKDMLSALCMLGDAGIIHRDVKSANILINRQGECYLADFGTAIFKDDIAQGQPMDIVGTPMYMAPEIVRTIPTQYDERVDSWALGIVAYEVMLGRTPFQMLGVADHQELVFKELRCRDDMEDLIVPYMGDGRNGGEVAERWGNFYNFIKACLKICPWNRPSAQDFFDQGKFSMIHTPLRPKLGALFDE